MIYTVYIAIGLIFLFVITLIIKAINRGVEARSDISKKNEIKSNLEKNNIVEELEKLKEENF